MHRFLIAATALVSASFLATNPASAQDGVSDKMNLVIVYGQDECPIPTGDEITVCARKDEGERYRIPEVLREAPGSPNNDAWNNRVIAYESISRTGAQSCSPTGAGGWTGCAQKMINSAYAQKENDPAIRFSELIAEERARRLSTIDADAAATQARVEQAEKDYLAREAAGQQTSAPAEQASGK